MAIRSYQLVLAATQKRVSDVYGGVSSNGVIDPKQDIPYREIKFQAEAAAAYLGMDTTVGTTNYGTTIASAGTVTFGPFESGPVHLSDFYAVGAGATLHVTGIPF